MTLNKQWVAKTADGTIAQKLQNELNISPLLARLLTIRKIKNLDAGKRFLSPSLGDLRDPDLFADMTAAVKRIYEAIINDETIGIFGDYDVDGVCSSAILQLFLNSVGAKTTSTLPNRLLEGYGLSKAGVERLKNASATLIIAADCGTLAHEQIAFAKSLALEVIVVDHHKVGDVLPDAVAVINPQRSDCLSEAKFLCAAGVCFFLCMALRRYLRGKDYFLTKPEPDLRELLDLVSLATVCDVVPLIEENRTMVKAGLLAIKQGRRLGLNALIEACGIDKNKISSTNLGFHLGPRINAAGRLADATLALKLLVSDNFAQAKIMAAELNEQNQERKAIEQQTVEEACAKIDAEQDFHDAKALVLHDESWHSGVVGIVASRIAEKYHKPAIIIGQHGKGSGRSISGVDLHEMVSKASSSLAGFGGHAHAIGLTLGTDGVHKFSEDLLKIMQESIPQQTFDKQIFYDTTINISDVSLELQHELSALEPFGAHNSYPVMRIDKSSLRNLRRLNGGHIKGELEGPGGFVPFIGFRMDLAESLASSQIDVLAVLEKNEWQGRVSVQLRLIDYKISP